MLQVRLRLPDVTALPQPTSTNRLFMSPLDTRPCGIARSESLGPLFPSGSLQRFMMLTRLQPDDPWLLLRLRAPSPKRAGSTIFPSEPRLEDHAVFRIGVGEP